MDAKQSDRHPSGARDNAKTTLVIKNNAPDEGIRRPSRRRLTLLRSRFVQQASALRPHRPACLVPRCSALPRKCRADRERCFLPAE
jgi:hypothetical protein